MLDFQTLYDRHYQALVYHAIHHYKLLSDDAEQVATDALMDLYVALEAGQEIQNPSTVLYYQLRLRVIDVYRSARARRRQLKLLRAKFTGYSTRDIMYEHPGFAEVDARDAIEAIWSRLTPAQQELASHVYLHGLTQPEAAKKMKISLNTLEKRMISLRKRLRILLSSALSPA